MDAPEGKVSPLFIAAQCNHNGCVSVLVHAGADCNRGSHCIPPLFIASQHGYFNVARRLLKCKADVNRARTDGTTSLAIAIQMGHLEGTIVMLLVSFSFGQIGLLTTYLDTDPQLSSCCCDRVRIRRRPTQQRGAHQS